MVSFTRESPDNFTLKLSKRLECEPGQFVQVSLPGVGECPISVCSASGEPLELNVRQVGVVTNALAQLKRGDAVFVRGPYGKGYPMALLKGNSLVLVGGGCGVAPLKGVVEYVARHREDFREVYLFLGFRSPSDVLFQRHLAGWKARYRLSVSVDENPANTCFDGKVGFVTKLLEEARFDNSNKVVFMCGPPRMMDACAAVLRGKGFHDDQIFVSAERLMYCGVGKCCHCMIRGKFTCVDGPVFRLDELGGFKE